MVKCFSTGKKAVPSKNGRLKVLGGKLCDQKGEIVQLKGLSTHWLSWYANYVNQDFFHELAEKWNCNVVRLAMYTAELDGYCVGGDKEGLRKLIREGVEYAKNADLYVLVDWHILKDSDPNIHKEDAIAFFDEMASEFAKEEHVIYEICNEPNKGCDWDDVKAYANEVIPVIREHDPLSPIVVGTCTWSQDVDIAAEDPLMGYENLLYSLHFYAASHKEKLRTRMRKALDAGLPMFVTEYGICDASGGGDIDREEARKWFGLLDENDISYIAWNISFRDETSAIFRPDRAKFRDLTEDDMTDYGKAIYGMLTGKGI